MTNAKQEFLELIQHVETSVLCATVEYKGLSFNLPQGFNTESLTCFVDNLNFEYDSGYGGQELFGTIWFTDGTWAERGEYDGSEWWNHMMCPDIPKSLT